MTTTQKTTTPKVELKSIKFAASLSQETNAFTATVYIDGEKVGTAENHGQGGPTSVHPRAAEERLTAIAATLPDIECTIRDGGEEKKWSYRPSAETIVDDLLTAHLMAKEEVRFEKLFAKDLSTRIMWLTTKGEVRQTKKLSPADVQKNLVDPRFLASRAAQGDRLLNTMAKDEARAIWRKAVGL